MKKILRLMLSSFLCITLFSNTFAQQEIVGKAAQLDTILKQLNILNPSMDGIKTSELIAVVEQHNMRRGMELKEYLATVPEFKTRVVIPKFTLEDGAFHAAVQGEKVVFKIISSSEVEIFFQNKSAVISKEMSLKEIQAIIEKTFSVKQKVTWLNLFIPNAQAFFWLPFAILAACSLIFLALKLGLEIEDFKKAVGELDFYCKKLKDKAVEGLDVTELKSDLEKLTSLNLATCVYSGHMKPSNYNEKTCKETLPNTIKCFKGVIERAESKKINDSSKSNEKKPEIDTPSKSDTSSAKKS